LGFPDLPLGLRALDASQAAFEISIAIGALTVSVDKTLKTKRGFAGSRNVLSRGERIARLMEEDRFAAGRSPFGLPKVRVQKALAGKKKKKTVEEGADATAAAKGAKGAKGKK
jgi:small basic protein (TIGR04137 family)